MMVLVKTWTKRLLVFAILVVGGFLLAIPLAIHWKPDDLVPVGPSESLAVDNVNVITMTDAGVLRDRQVRIRDGVIEAIEAAGSPVDADYRVIDADGGYLLPGLFDMHVHALDRKYLSLSLAHGVTSVRNMGGYPMHLRWKRELADGEWLGSNLFTASPAMNGARNSNPFGHKVVSDPDQARELVRRYQAEGYDFIKAYTRLEVDIYQAIIDEASQLDFPVAGHVPYKVVDFDYRLAEPMVTLEHTEEIFQGPMDFEYDDSLLEQAVATLKDLDATVTPTLMIFDHLTQIAQGKQSYIDTLELDYLNPLMRAFESQGSVKRWLNADDRRTASLAKRNDYFQHITRVLYENDIPMVLGSDWGVIYAVPGIATHEEITLMQQAGLPAEVVLKMATVNAARVLTVDDQLGSIALGKVADLILSETDPLADLGALRTPSAVIKAGRWLGPEDLEALKQSAKNPSSLYLTGGRMLEFLIYK